MVGDALVCVGSGTTRLLLIGDVFLAEEIALDFWHAKYQDVKAPIFSAFLHADPP
jgi:hypothetical protein